MTKCMKCDKEAMFFGIDVELGDIIFCKEHLDEFNIRKTGMKWDEVPEG